MKRGDHGLCGVADEEGDAAEAQRPPEPAHPFRQPRRAGDAAGDQEEQQVQQRLDAPEDDDGGTVGDRARREEHRE